MEKLTYKEFLKEIKTNRELQTYVAKKTSKIFDSQTTARSIYAQWFVYNYEPKK